MSEQEMTPEQTRVEMRRRFDAANAEAKNRRENRYNSRGATQAEQDKRWLRNAPEETGTPPVAGTDDPA